MLNRLFFLNPLNGWVVGIDGIIINTNDGGATWNQLKPFTSLNFYSVFFHDSLNGWISANNSTYFFTNDGGKSWIERKLKKPNEHFNLFSLSFTDKLKGILVSDYGHIFITSDMGENWADATERLFSNDVLSVHLNNDNEGWLAGGGGHIFYTANGGDSWMQQQTGTTEHLYSIQFLDSNYGWAVGFGGTFLKTTNGGKNWVLNKLSKDEFLKVFFLDSLNGWIAGSTGYIGPYAPQGKIFKTTDGGKTWKSWNFYSSFPGNGMGFSDAFFTTKDTGWVISVNEIYSTVDGGDNWNKDVKSREFYYSISFADHSTGWIAGCIPDEKEEITYMVKKTTDAGKTWIYKKGPNITGHFDIHFIDLNNGWILDSGGRIFNTSDGGENWIEDESIREQRINIINFSSLKHGIAAGKAGLIMRFDNQIDGISGDFPVNAKETLYFLFPTQTSDIIQIKTRKNDDRNLPQISIINILGNIILSTESRDRIDVGFLSPGVYFVRIGDELMKFIKL
jgi:photosystem II stability/assembly factor-like uncharacterized protein